MTQHHPTEHILIEHAAGALSAGPALCVASHLEFCSECAQHNRQLSQLGSAMMMDTQEGKVEDNLFDQIMQRVDEPVEKRPSKKTGIDKVLQQLLPNGLSGVAWKRMAGGVSSFDLGDIAEGFAVKLMKVERGRSVLQHTHTGNEFSVLLQGGYSDELGNYYRGDFVECSDQHTHKPVAHRNEDCILLTAVHGELKFTGTLGRLLNPFVKF